MKLKKAFLRATSELIRVKRVTRSPAHSGVSALSCAEQKGESEVISILLMDCCSCTSLNERACRGPSMRVEGKKKSKKALGTALNWKRSEISQIIYFSSELRCLFFCCPVRHRILFHEWSWDAKAKDDASGNNNNSLPSPIYKTIIVAMVQASFAIFNFGHIASPVSQLFAYEIGLDLIKLLAFAWRSFMCVGGIIRHCSERGRAWATASFCGKVKESHFIIFRLNRLLNSIRARLVSTFPSDLIRLPIHSKRRQWFLVSSLWVSCVERERGDLFWVRFPFHSTEPKRKMKFRALWAFDWGESQFHCFLASLARRFSRRIV